MTTTEPFRPSQVAEQASDDELRDALIREARQRARRRRSMYVGAVVVTAVAAIAAWSTASSGNPPPPAAQHELPPPGPRTSAAASPTSTVPLPAIGFPPGMRLVAPGPSRSPDGTKIVYDARDDSTGQIGDLFVEEAATGVRTQITHLDLRASGWEFPLAPTFSSDGQTVLFMLPNLSRLGGSDVWSVPVTGGEPTLVIEHAMWPTPLPDGKTIGYVSEPPRIVDEGHYLRVFSDIWVASIDEPGSARLVTSTVGRGIFGMVASPDGTALIYHEDGAGDHGVDIATGRSTSPDYARRAVP